MTKLMMYFLAAMAVGASPAASGSCERLLGLKEEVSTSFKRARDQFLRIGEGVQAARGTPHLTMTSEQLKSLKSPSKVMTLLKKLSHMRLPPASLVWWALQDQIFKDDTLINPELVLGIGTPVVDSYEELFDPQYSPALYKQAHQGNIAAKRALANYLDQLAVVASAFFEQPIDLLTERGWLTILGIETSDQVGPRIDTLMIRNTQIGIEIAKFHEDLSTRSGLYKHYVLHFFGTGRRRVSPEATALIEKMTYQEIASLIEDLGLRPNLRDEYLRQIGVLKSAPEHNQTGTKILAVLVFYRAYMEKFEKIVGLTDQPVGERRIFTPQFFQMKQKVGQTKLANAFLEVQFEEYILESERLNKRLEALRERFDLLARDHIVPQEQMRQFEIEIKAIPEIAAFDEDLSAIAKSITALEIELDAVTEAILEEKDRESLKNFSDLNFRGQRIIAKNSYAIKGVDYGSVVFGDDVVKFFESRPVDAARFLSALSKGYVGVKGASGLRRLPTIHDDFRDIKVINSSFGKIRIVGKRFGDTLYFFYVYQSEKPYNTQQMKDRIEHFQASSTK